VKALHHDLVTPHALHVIVEEQATGFGGARVPGHGYVCNDVNKQLSEICPTLGRWRKDHEIRQRVPVWRIGNEQAMQRSLDQFGLDRDNPNGHVIVLEASALNFPE
jgi:hypothetical protein